MSTIWSSPQSRSPSPTWHEAQPFTPQRSGRVSPSCPCFKLHSIERVPFTAAMKPPPQSASGPLYTWLGLQRVSRKPYRVRLCITHSPWLPPRMAWLNPACYGYVQYSMQCASTSNTLAASGPGPMSMSAPKRRRSSGGPGGQRGSLLRYKQLQVQPPHGTDAARSRSRSPFPIADTTQVHKSMSMANVADNAALNLLRPQAAALTATAARAMAAQQATHQLAEALTAGSVDDVKQALRSGASANALLFEWCLPVVAAVALGQAHLVGPLLHAGANPNGCAVPNACEPGHCACSVLAYASLLANGIALLQSRSWVFWSLVASGYVTHVEDALRQLSWPTWL